MKDMSLFPPYHPEQDVQEAGFLSESVFRLFPEFSAVTLLRDTVLIFHKRETALFSQLL